MRRIRALIAAAGKGSRSGLPYPKTLFVVQGEPILARIHRVVAAVDPRPTIVVSPQGKDMVSACLLERHMDAHIVIQEEPGGMGDAVLRFRDSPAFANADDVLLVWGDIPFLQRSTVDLLVSSHRDDRNDFTFATRHVASPYTLVKRDDQGRVMEVVETREAGIEPPEEGEREIGLFLFGKDAVFPLLDRELDGKWGVTTGEHGFLYIIRHLAGRGFRASGLPIATPADLVSFNSLADIEPHV